MKRRRQEVVQCPQLEDLGKTLTVPELPRAYRTRLWKTIKVKSHFVMPEESQHFINLLCLHFGLSRSDIVIHAVNLLWREVLESVDAEQIKMYEDKLEAVRLYRLQAAEEKHDAAARANLEAVEEYVKATGDARDTRSPQGRVWAYNSHYPSGDSLEHAKSDEEDDITE